MPIEVLAPDVVSKIAAGEVVERPASVVKELIENAIDAGSTKIKIEVKHGGIKLIRVVDNGSGIPAREVALAFQRHATSKVRGAADLDSISTLGFRGEALPSISVVSQVDIITKTNKDSTGTYIVLHGGRITEQGKKASPQGTSVTVQNLFQNVPARLKFLKSISTESAHISDLVAQYSLAYPEIKFELATDGKTVLQTPGNGSLRDVLVETYGLKTAEAMIEVGEGGSQVYGFVSAPSLTRSRRDSLSFFVNRRWVRSGLLARATEEAYSGLLMTGKHPITVLNISIPLGDIDVNVHPAKTEVRFRSEGEVFTLVQRAVRAALVAESSVPDAKRSPRPLGSPTATGGADRGVIQERLFREPAHAQAQQTPRALPESRLPILRIIGQLATTYIVAEGPDGMYLIDQHAAHERILFEKVMAQRVRSAVAVQGMLEPVTIELSLRQESLLNRAQEALKSYGFAVESFGGKTYLVRTAPALLGEGDIIHAVHEIIDMFSEAGDRSNRDEEIAASIACHGAVRAGKVLTMEEMVRLICDLESAESPLTCPHGRPTMVHFNTSHLEREFGRSL
ncbi:MAG: DNA mismatch repair endonuclease MutL [Dehalococcoidia bacterium]|jgi:DNA mismatch repair protein MutL